MKLITDNFNISGKLYYDLGYNIAGVNNKYNINLTKFENSLEQCKGRIINAKNNYSAFCLLKAVCKRYNVNIHGRFQPRPEVHLSVWVDGEFECVESRVSLWVSFNAEKAINNETWDYLKQQIISKFMHEIVHFLRYIEDKTRWNDGDFHEYDISKYLSSVEEQYSYATEAIFEIMTGTEQTILDWYNRTVHPKSLFAFSKVVNQVSKAPMFNNCIEVELV